MSELAGPMFEPAITNFWESSFRRDGAHYNIFSTKGVLGMDGLRTMFPKAKADELNFCLFSTSGIHGCYSTIEDAEKLILNPEEDQTPSVTFLVIHPRIVCLRYGNCEPKNQEDIEWLKKLRSSSWDAMQKIGKKEVWYE